MSLKSSIKHLQINQNGGFDSPVKCSWKKIKVISCLKPAGLVKTLKQTYCYLKSLDITTCLAVVSNDQQYDWLSEGCWDNNHLFEQAFTMLARMLSALIMLKGWQVYPASYISLWQWVQILSKWEFIYFFWRYCKVSNSNLSVSSTFLEFQTVYEQAFTMLARMLSQLLLC